jgi:hypothetical protein
MKYLIVIFFISCNIANALSMNSVIMPIEKVIKTFGISNLEKTLLKNAKYVYRSGKLVAQRNSTFFPHIKDALGRSNIERMEKGLAPLGKDGKAVELHHLKQKDNGVIVELTSMEHNLNSKVLHQYKQESEIDRKAFNTFRSKYWKARAEDFK